MNKKDQKYKNFEGCVNICKETGEKIENCMDACSVAVKNLHTDKTKLSIGTKNLNANVETENSSKGWILIIIFAVIVFLILKFVF